MPTFHYKAHRADETPVDGRIEADDLKSARLSLESQGLRVSSVHQVEDAPLAGGATGSSTQAHQALQGQIDRVLAMGKPLAAALLAYAQELPPGKRRLHLQRIANQLEQGRRASLGAGQIDEEWIPLLAAGTSSGDPSQIPSAIIDEFQQADNLRGHVGSALAYPLVLFAVSAAVLLTITLWIIPHFHDIFGDFDLELPTPTILVFTISETVRSFWWAILLPVLILAAALCFISGFRDWIIRFVPVFGGTVRLSDRARFTRYLADLIEAKVPVADALRISGWNTGEAQLRRDADRLAMEIDLGNTDLGDSPTLCRSFPHTVIHALQIQANPKAAGLILRELSWMYEQQTRDQFAWISSLAEPVFIIFLGATVGFYVVALFMPMVTLIQNLT